jgi:HEAT repeat protein
MNRRNHGEDAIEKPQFIGPADLEETQLPTSILPDVLLRLGLSYDPVEDPFVALDSKDARMRARALLTLSEMGEQAPLAPIVAALNNPEEEQIVRLAALYALRKLAPRHPKIVSRYLLDAWRESQGVLRAVLLEMLGGLKTVRDRQLIDLLYEALADADEEVRIAALYLAGKRGGREMKEKIKEALGDSRWRVREEAAFALGSLMAQGLAWPAELIKALYDHSPYVRRAALHALGDHFPLDQILTDLRIAEKPGARTRAARILGESGREEALQPLIEATGKEYPAPAREAALLALGHLAEHITLPRRVVVSALREAQNDNDEDVRETSAMVLDALYPDELSAEEPRTIGRYILRQRIGVGPWSVVYRGEERHSSSEVAIKLLNGLKLDRQGQEGFRRRLELLSGLRHPHILRIRDSGIDESDGHSLFIVMDYVARGSLDQYHPPGTIVPLGTVRSYARQIAAALQYAHEHNIAHLNLKPSNILLIGGHDEIVVSDFRLALRATPADYISAALHSEGDAARRADALFYKAPEMRGDNPQGSPASDQYSLAVLIYEWLTGHHPIAEGRGMGRGGQQWQPPRSLREYNPKLPREIDAIIMKALASEPKERYPSIQAFAEALLAALQPSRRRGGKKKPGPPSGPPWHLSGLLLLLVPALLRRLLHL